MKSQAEVIKNYLEISLQDRHSSESTSKEKLWGIVSWIFRRRRPTDQLRSVNFGLQTLFLQNHFPLRLLLVQHMRYSSFNIFSQFDFRASRYYCLLSLMFDRKGSQSLMSVCLQISKIFSGFFLSTVQWRS